MHGIGTKVPDSVYNVKDNYTMLNIKVDWLILSFFACTWELFNNFKVLLLLTLSAHSMLLPLSNMYQRCVLEKCIRVGWKYKVL